MADVPSSKKRTAKSGKTAKIKKSRKTTGGPPGSTESDRIEEHPHPELDRTREQLKNMSEKFAHVPDSKEIHDLLDSTRSQLGKLGEKLHEAADKGMHMVKEIAEEVHRFSHDATELTKVKIEIHNLKNEKNSLLSLMGEKLRNLHRADKLDHIGSKFSYDFNKLDDLDEQLSKKEREADNLARDIREIR